MNRRNKKPTLLIIDDEKMICEILSNMVNNLTQRINVITASSVEEALRLLPKADMIISDIKMPNQHLLDQALKSVMAEKPIARMSGYTQDCTNFMISKPFRQQQVAETLQFLYSFLRSNSSSTSSAA